MLPLFAAAGSFLANAGGSLAIAGAGILNGLLGKNNAEKSRQLAVHQQGEVSVREKERLEIQAKIEYTRLMCQKIQHQESLSFQEDRRGIYRTAQSALAKSNQSFQQNENALNRSLQRTNNQVNLAFQKEQREIDRQQNPDFLGKVGVLASHKFTESPRGRYDSYRLFVRRAGLIWTWFVFSTGYPINPPLQSLVSLTFLECWEFDRSFMEL